MKCPKCNTFVLFQKVSFTDGEYFYFCTSCGFGSDKLKDFWSKDKK